MTGTFGSTSASLTLPVRDEVLDAVSSVDWTIPQIEDGTFLDVINYIRKNGCKNMPEDFNKCMLHLLPKKPDITEPNIGKTIKARYIIYSL